MARMSKWERLEATVARESTDQLPWSLWRHFYARETSAEDLAQAMLDWQARNDFDLLKVNPRAQYHAEVWGARYRYPQRDAAPVAENLPIQDVEGWARIGVQSATAPALEEQLRALTRIGKGLRGSTPFVETVFSPLSIAGYLVDDVQILRRHLREEPRAVHHGLRAIAETFVGFVHEVLNTGASGIFFATTSWATHDMLTEEEYATFGRPYDLQVLAAAREARLNVLHVCRANNMLRQLLDYPVQVLNWAAPEKGNPSLGEMADELRGRAVAGGLSDEALAAPDERRVLREAAEAKDQAGNRGLILAGNCSISLNSSQKNIDAVRRWLLEEKR